MVEYVSSIQTDHRGLYLAMILTPFERGLGYWKFNTSLLHKHDFVQLMREEILVTLEASESKLPGQKWEILKDRIRTITKKYSKKHVNEEKVVIAQLSEIVSGYESNLPLNREDMNLYEESKAELEEKSLERIRGVMFRSKVKWYEEGEKSSKYFFSLEKARYNAKGQNKDYYKEVLKETC